ncbi:MAG: YceI family protein [Pseudomonadota bacterium]
MKKRVRISQLALVLAASNAVADVTHYTIDNDHTHVVWEVDRFGFTKTIGTFAEVSGTLVWNPSDITASHVTVSIPLSGLRSDLPLREDIVRSSFWLDSGEFPEITFESNSVVPSELARCATTCFEVGGNLTIKGVSKSVTLQVALNKAGTDPVSQKQAVGFTAHGSFQRTDFDINTAVGPIGDEVRFRIEVLAIESE